MNLDKKTKFPISLYYIFSVIISVKMYPKQFFGLKIIMKSGLEKIFLKLGSFHKLRLHLGVGRWLQKHVP